MTTIWYWPVFTSALEGNKERYAHEYRFRRADGEYCYVYDEFSIVRDAKGHPVEIIGNWLDISERKQAEIALKESEERYRGLINIAPLGIAIHQDGEWVMVNQYTIKMLGYKSENEMLGQSILDIAYPNYKEIATKRISEMTRTGKQAVPIEAKMLKRDGSAVDVLVTGVPIIYKGKQAFELAVMNITEHKQAEEEVKKLSEVVRQSIDIVFITDPNGNIEYVNPAFEKITGYTKEEVIGQTSRILKSGEMSDEYYKKVWNTILSGKPMHAEVIDRKKNGELFIYDQTITPLKDLNGNIINFISTGSDVTERRAAEKKLKESEVKFRTLFEESQDAILITTVDGRFLDFNRSAKDLFGYDREELLALLVTELYVNKDDRVRFVELIESQGFVKDFELQLRKKDGAVIDIIESASVRRDSDGNIISYRSIIRDITERNRARETLKEALEQAKEGERVKSLFLANMSHEIRTPLNAILGYTELLEVSTAHMVGDEEQEFFNAVKNNCNRLMGTVHEILDMSQIEAGTFKTHIKKHNLVELLNIATVPLQPKAVNAGLEFEVRSAVKEATINADEYCVIQAISNVVENGIKYTSKGRVEVILEETNNTFNVCVIDTGVGIAKENIKAIFKEFKQESEGYTKKYQGVGLGLSLVKKYLDICHAKIEVKSEKDMGTTFILKFPKWSRPNTNKK